MNHKLFFVFISIFSVFALAGFTFPDAKSFRGIYSYQCDQSFLEGSGVTESTISCQNTPDLGFLQAKYTYYVYSSAAGSGENNFSQKPTTAEYFSNYCNRSSDARVSCGAIKAVPDFWLQKDYGSTLNGVQVNVEVYLRAAPGRTVEKVGYAALPQSNGQCPMGLIPIRTWRASPPSITKGFFFGGPTSSFINDSGILDSVVISDALYQPASFMIFRNPNLTPCDTANNDCSKAQFQGWSVAQTQSYNPDGLVVCALPSGAVNP